MIDINDLPVSDLRSLRGADPLHVLINIELIRFRKVVAKPLHFFATAFHVGRCSRPLQRQEGFKGAGQHGDGVERIVSLAEERARGDTLLPEVLGRSAR
jgi:hypothetical protein